MIAAGLLIGTFIGFIVGGVFTAAISAGKSEDHCRACQRDAILGAYRLTDGEAEWRDGTDD